jgi:hypothetical protein
VLDALLAKHLVLDGAVTSNDVDFPTALGDMGERCPVFGNMKWV